MKRTKKCADTLVKISIKEKLETKQQNRRFSSAGIFCTSSAGAVNSLILMLTLSFISAFCFNLLSNNAAYAYQISMDYSGAQSIDVALDGSGMGTSIAKDDISITTTCPTGYNLSISTSVNDNNLYLDGSASNNQSGKYFSPVDGVNSLASNTNKWGYYFNNNSATAPTSDSVFAAVPTPASPAVIKTPSISTTSDSSSLYYGVSINSGLAAGTYKMVKESGSSTNDGTIVYYLTMDEACNYAGYMQDMTEEDLEELIPNAGDTVRLADRRDEEVYLVGRLADGNVWLLDNLRLGGNTTMNLTPNDTNITSNFTLPVSTTTGFTDDTTGYTQSAINADYKNTIVTSYGAGSGKVGNYYNYCAASGGTFCYSSSSGTGDAKYDICPAGWRMPTGGNSGEYNYLYTNGYSSNVASFKNALSTPLSGSFYDGSVNSHGVNGAFWSATRSSVNLMYYLGIELDNVYPSFNDRRYVGFSVRCVKKPDTNYMQEVTDAKLAKLMPSDGSSTTLYDKRDDKDYQVTRINGNYWMTQNLRFSGTSISPELTNINTSKTLSWGDLTSGNSYTAARYHNSGNNTTGYWYNFAGASAMTIATNSNSNPATYDICPKGWKLPTSSELATITSSSSSFSPITGGYYSGGSATSTTSGYWWASDASSTTVRYRLQWNGSALSSTGTNNRRHGLYIRCKKLPPTMQSVDSSTLASMMPNLGDTTTLRDARDDEEYLIGKLADGNYWMLDNLRLGSTSTMSLTSEDTNIPNNWTLPMSGTANFTTSTGYTTAAINTTSKNTATTNYGAGSGKIGTYYNYCAASAGEICTSSNSNNATRDICPKGWRMPTGGSSGEYQALYTAYSSNASNFLAALSTPLSGTFYNGSPYDQKSRGFFWSSIRGNDTFMTNLLVTSSEVYPNDANGRFAGLPMRCVKKIQL